MRKGSNKRSNWVDVDSIVLVGLRQFQTNVVDIVHVYSAVEARKLQEHGVQIGEKANSDEKSEEEQPFDFGVL
jgi:hypothetical protein